VHAVAWLLWPVELPYDPAGQSVQDVAAAADHEPAGHDAHVEPLRNEPARHTAVPAKVTPPDVSVQADAAADDADAPSAKQRTLPVARLSASVAGLGVNE